jgi:7,8-dihydropterin-6-yl-methyl-4-(beta-D-ribofuranosyl)aminobenzene 5'-phosphate synthase
MRQRSFLRVLLLIFGALILSVGNLNAANANKKAVKVLMIYNNVGAHEGYINDWGLSVWIETDDDAVLFDTGADSTILLKNIKSSGIDLNKLSKIIISHKHEDHTNGISAVLEQTKYKPEVLVPDFDLINFKIEDPKANYIGIKDPVQINKYIWTTGELEGTFKNEKIYEQSLIIVHDDSIIILTGCSHSGIAEIVKKAKQLFPDKQISIVAGGFHLYEHSEEQINEISSKLTELNVVGIAPSHCSGDNAINLFKEKWGDRFIEFNIGDNLKIIQ